MPKMLAAQVVRPGGPFEIVEREIPEPGAGRSESRSRPAASATATRSRRTGLVPGIQYPRVPGHEVAGRRRCRRRGRHGMATGPARRRRLARRIIAARATTAAAAISSPARRSSNHRHHVRRRLCGIHGRARQRGGADAGRVVRRGSGAAACALASRPSTRLRNSGARPGDIVAVLGLGGLGHLGVQYAAKMGFTTVAIARGKDKEPLAKQLGACASTSTARRRTRQRSCRSSAARRSSSRR